MPADGFGDFVAQRRKDLARIARHTSGEYELQDVIGEAFLMAADIAERRGRAVDWSDPADQERVLAYLYQKLVRYTETTVRFAVRLDERLEDEDGDFVHPLVRTLASDGGRDPLAAAMEKELQRAAPTAMPRYCLATAWIQLVRHFDNRMQAVANHLLISVGHAYKCCAKARVYAANQSPMPGKTMPEAFPPGPWRAFRLWRVPEQLTFDFREQLPLLECWAS